MSRGATSFCFGYKKRGDVELLKRFAGPCGYELIVIEKEQYEGREISSTFVREQLKAGNIEVMNDLLGYPYTVLGCVKHGQKLGRQLGFPTMNIHTPPDKQLPPNGVYFCTVQTDQL